MIASAPSLRVALFGVLFTACDPAPLGVWPTHNDSSSPQAAVTGGVTVLDGSGVVAGVAGVNKGPINGTFDQVGAGPLGRTLITPSGRCHLWDSPGFIEFRGDVAGPVTFHEQGHGPCDLSDLVGSGPFEGEVTWNGRSGVISGQWTTNCNADPSQPVGLSCDGTMNARGRGDLEGVQFHFKWGPGWFPFPYTGTAFSQ